MRERTVAIAEAQHLLESLSEQFSEDCSALVITRDSQPALAIMSYQAYQEMLANVKSLQTILEIMLGGEKADEPRPAKAEIPRSKSISWEEFQKEVGW